MIYDLEQLIKLGRGEIRDLLEKSKHCDYLEDLAARQAKEIERLRHEIRLMKFEAEGLQIQALDWKVGK